MKKLVLLCAMAISINAQALIGAASSNGFVAAYFYFVGGVTVASDALCALTYQKGVLCYDSRVDWKISAPGFRSILGIVLLDDGTRAATFPELDKETSNKLDLTPQEVDSYNNDLTALRLSLEHLSSDIEAQNVEDLMLSVDEIDRTLTRNFSVETMSVVQKLREHNARHLE